MEEKLVCSCIDCAVTNCNDPRKGAYPDFCLTTHMDPEVKAAAMAAYEEEENRKVMCAAAEVECDGYGQLTRVQEVMDFARRMGCHKLGIATCVGLIRESRTLAKILRANGFEVYGVACKVGAVNKTDVGIDPRCCAVGDTMCNPVLQAKLLNEAGTELNIVMGLCVGHDSLFYKHSDAIVTTLVTKDRVTGHNPAAALYNAEGYYKKKLFPQPEEK